MVRAATGAKSPAGSGGPVGTGVALFISSGGGAALASVRPAGSLAFLNLKLAGFAVTAGPAICLGWRRPLARCNAIWIA
jgi:hypothetical protein